MKLKVLGVFPFVDFEIFDFQEQRGFRPERRACVTLTARRARLRERHGSRRMRT